MNYRGPFFLFCFRPSIHEEQIKSSIFIANITSNFSELQAVKTDIKVREEENISIMF